MKVNDLMDKICEIEQGAHIDASATIKEIREAARISTHMYSWILALRDLSLTMSLNTVPLTIM